MLGGAEAVRGLGVMGSSKVVDVLRVMEVVGVLRVSKVADVLSLPR